MEKLTILMRDNDRALTTLQEIFETPYSIIVRDAAIQRFEYCFEIGWKFLKEFLRSQEGIICNSPKSCFREAFKNGLLDESETILALQMTDDRNQTSHTYHEEIADEIFSRLNQYAALLNKLSIAMKEKNEPS